MVDEARQKTVLIVDNDKEVRDLLARMVEKMGYRAVVVENATRAAPLLAKSDVDAMLLDLNMPGAQGEHLLHFLRRNKVPVPPTIVVSGYLHKDRIRPLIELGVSGIVAKPFAVDRLMGELRRVVEGEDQAPTLCCPQCGAAGESGARFCSSCGARISPE